MVCASESVFSLAHTYPRHDFNFKYIKYIKYNQIYF